VDKKDKSFRQFYNIQITSRHRISMDHFVNNIGEGSTKDLFQGLGLSGLEGPEPKYHSFTGEGINRLLMGTA
jgi:hypothetical protein